MTRELGNLSHSSRKRCRTQRDATAPSTGNFWQSIWPLNTSVVDFVSMAKAQKLDPQIRALQSSPNTSLKIEAVPIACSPTDTILCDTSTGTQRPLIPLDWRRVIFDSMHGLSHPGIRATQKLITARFVWPGANADVRRWSRSCIQCQRSKIHRRSFIAVSTIASSSIRHSPHRSRRTLTPFSRIHLPVDLRGQVYSLARSISTLLNHCRGSSSSFYPWVDFPFRCSISNRHRSRTTFRVWFVEGTYDSAGCETVTYNSVPSAVEWHGRAPSLSIESSTQSTWQHLLDGFPATCSTWH